VTSKEGILIDEDDNYECDENPDGDHHQLGPETLSGESKLDY